MPQSDCAVPPVSFVDLQSLIPDIVLEMAYAGHNNFVGRPIDGYLVARALVTHQAAAALQRVQQVLRAQGLTLKIFDAYRPQRAVRDFIRWRQEPDHPQRKARYYPDLSKAELFTQCYLAEASSHSRGSTLDLTVMAAGPHHQAPGPVCRNGELDMGTPFDWFGPASHTDYPALDPALRANRQWLCALMRRFGFANLPQEWWHFSLIDEPYPQGGFDVPIR